MTTRHVQSGTLPDSTPVAVDIEHENIPATVTLKSSDGGRLVEISTDGGIEYFTPDYDKTTATMIVVSIGTPISHVRFTGATADTWSVR